MAEKNFPLPVKKNKFGQDVSKLTTTDYYLQVFDEVLKAYRASILSEVNRILHYDGCGQCAEQVEDVMGNNNEAEELVDVMTCCITRLDILGYTVDKNHNIKYDVSVNPMPKITAEQFYQLLTLDAAESYRLARNYNDEIEIATLLAVIDKCRSRLEQIGYNADARQIIYATANAKNYRLGYLGDNNDA